ncbi:MAG: NAD(P)/FAD-dependent oxidoreductase [Candidatus Omnitrophica bacterium]|nr:NAD(P)/FAD-dependent oxidoreductase [Candidatus Omnitrophota bacterium]
MEKKANVLVIGAGPAGLCAGIETGKSGAKVIVIDENTRPGGQLFKQIHRFFGSEQHHAGVRGFEIGEMLLHKCKEAGVEMMLSSVVWGLSPEFRAGVVREGKRSMTITADKVILATGASENSLMFPGWTLPGVMGAGAAQTMMNIHRVLPGKRALMIGSGNVGLIVSYQLLQAGCEVKAVVEILPRVGGYKVHANKIARLGVDILISHTVLEVRGRERVEEAIVGRGDRNLRPIPGTERTISVDLVCLAVGLTPLSELAWLAGCKFGYFPLLGGFVPLHNRGMETTVSGMYIAGDASGIEEASTAMEEGRLAGVGALESLAFISAAEADSRRKEIEQNLLMLRKGPYGDFRHKEKEKIYSEWKKVKEKAGGYH